MRNDSVDHPRNFREKSVMGTATSYSDVVFDVLREEYAPLKHAAEYLARDAGATPRAAENWLAGLCAPTGEKVLNLMAACEPLRVAMNQAAIERRNALRQGARDAEQYVVQRRFSGKTDGSKSVGVAGMEGF